MQSNQIHVFKFHNSSASTLQQFFLVLICSPIIIGLCVKVRLLLTSGSKPVSSWQGWLPYIVFFGFFSLLLGFFLSGLLRKDYYAEGRKIYETKNWLGIPISKKSIPTDQIVSVTITKRFIKGFGANTQALFCLRILTKAEALDVFCAQDLIEVENEKNGFERFLAHSSKYPSP